MSDEFASISSWATEDSEDSFYTAATTNEEDGCVAKNGDEPYSGSHDEKLYSHEAPGSPTFVGAAIVDWEHSPGSLKHCGIEEKDYHNPLDHITEALTVELSTTHTSLSDEDDDDDDDGSSEKLSSLSSASIGQPIFSHDECSLTPHVADPDRPFCPDDPNDTTDSSIIEVNDEQLEVDRQEDGLSFWWWWWLAPIPWLIQTLDPPRPNSSPNKAGKQNEVEWEDSLKQGLDKCLVRSKKKMHEICSQRTGNQKTRQPVCKSRTLIKTKYERRVLHKLRQVMEVLGKKNIIITFRCGMTFRIVYRPGGSSSVIASRNATNWYWENQVCSWSDHSSDTTSLASFEDDDLLIPQLDKVSQEYSLEIFGNPLCVTDEPASQERTCDAISQDDNTDMATATAAMAMIKSGDASLHLCAQFEKKNIQEDTLHDDHIVALEERRAPSFLTRRMLVPQTLQRGKKSNKDFCPAMLSLGEDTLVSGSSSSSETTKSIVEGEEGFVEVGCGSCEILQAEGATEIYEPCKTSSIFAEHNTSSKSSLHDNALLCDVDPEQRPVPSCTSHGSSFRFGVLDDASAVVDLDSEQPSAVIDTEQPSAPNHGDKLPWYVLATKQLSLSTKHAIFAAAAKMSKSPPPSCHPDDPLDDEDVEANCASLSTPALSSVCSGPLAYDEECPLILEDQEIPTNWPFAQKTLSGYHTPDRRVRNPMQVPRLLRKSICVASIVLIGAVLAIVVTVSLGR